MVKMAVNFVVNELLCFVKFHYGKVSKGDILMCINGFYTDEEVSHDKKLIYQLLDGVEPKVTEPLAASHARRVITSDVWNVKTFWVH